MKRIFLLSGLLLGIALACSFGPTPQAESAPCPPTGAPMVVTQIVDAPAQSPLVLEADGKSSEQLGTEVGPYLVKAGWDTQGLNGDELVFFAPQELGLIEPGLSYHLSFDTSSIRGLAIVSSQLYFVPQKVGEPFDQTLLFNAIERDFPALSIYSDMEFNDQYTFRGVYTFNVRMDIADFINYLNAYAIDVDKLLLAHPFFSKQ